MRSRGIVEPIEGWVGVVPRGKKTTGVKKGVALRGKTRQLNI
jgi:hypothetical protein